MKIDGKFFNVSDSRILYGISGLILFIGIFIPLVIGSLIQHSLKPHTVFLQTTVGSQSTVIEVS